MSDEMTTERLAEIEARASAATPGPWDHTDDRCVLVDHSPDGSRVEWWCRGYRTCAQAAADARFMANARADVPALVAEVRRLSAIAAGRTTPPTDAELAAHAGEWLILLSSGSSTVEHMEWPSSRDYWILRGAVWWWPLRDGRPCPWPVTP